MAPFSKDAQKNSTKSQIEKYGGLEGYSAEMKRRRAKRTNYSTPSGFSVLKREDPEKFARIIADREIKRKINAQNKEEA